MPVIYALKDPITGYIRYVGKTSQSPAQRLRQHIGAALSGRSRAPVAVWIRALSALGSMPIQIVLERNVASSGWQEREKFWIAHYRTTGPMLNATDGGVGFTGYRAGRYGAEARTN